MLVPWEKRYDQPRQHIKKQRHYFANKVHLVKAMVFPVVMYRCESWTTKKSEHWRIDAFELWCWRRFLRVPWTARRSNQSILQGICPGCSLEGLTLKLKLQYCGHLMQRTDSLEKILMLEKIEGRRRRGPQRMSWLDCITDSVGMRLSWRRKQTELDSILGQAANIRLHAWSPSQWTLNFVPGVYRNVIPMGNQTPG